MIALRLNQLTLCAIKYRAMSEKEKLELATFGAGCFWCVEAVFLSLKGVEIVLPGYSGGHVKNPAYREVCNGTTGHAEVVRIEFQPDVISYSKLLEVLFSVHDPTTLNRQGADVGTQYRSAVFYHSEAQREAAETAIRALTESQTFQNKILTVVEPLVNFYPAEDYHVNYFAQHGDESYCAMVIRPKMDKFKTRHAELLKVQV